jgi:Golgi nucleoside diphosphatase
MHTQIIDGGSTGSRLHIFEFRKDISSNTTECIRKGSDRSNVPLSAFARTEQQIQNNEQLNATHIAMHLLPLFQYASSVIPSQYHASTAVYYQATAGMRLIDESEQNLVYDALYQGLTESPLFVFTALQRENIATLGGEEEALYGAVAANYLKGVVDVKLHMINKDGSIENEGDEFDGPLGALDMGGASMQIVYLPHETYEDDDCQGVSHSSKEPQQQQQQQQQRNQLGDNVQDKTTESPMSPSTTEHSMVEEKACENDLQELPNLPNQPNRLNGEEFFSTSYLSYGADQFRERLWDTWVGERETTAIHMDDSDSCDSKVIYNPCSFKGYRIEWKGYMLVGTGDAQKCTSEVNRLIPHHKETTDEILQIRTVGGVEHPPIRGHFFAMSLFFFSLDCLREISQHYGLNESWPTPSIADLTYALDMLCSKEWKVCFVLYSCWHANKYSSVSCSSMIILCFISPCPT